MESHTTTGTHSGFPQLFSVSGQTWAVAVFLLHTKLVPHAVNHALFHHHCIPWHICCRHLDCELLSRLACVLLYRSLPCRMPSTHLRVLLPLSNTALLHSPPAQQQSLQSHQHQQLLPSTQRHHQHKKSQKLPVQRTAVCHGAPAAHTPRVQQPPAPTAAAMLMGCVLSAPEALLRAQQQA